MVDIIIDNDIVKIEKKEIIEKWGIGEDDRNEEES